MSVVKQPRDWTEQERLEWVKTYQGLLDTPINSWIPEYAIDYKKKCCDNCEYFRNYLTRTNFCASGVANELLINEGIKDSDTFYCSYHKFKV